MAPDVFPIIAHMENKIIFCVVPRQNTGSTGFNLQYSWNKAEVMWREKEVRLLTEQNALFHDLGALCIALTHTD